jgi:hypothetical protein
MMAFEIVPLPFALVSWTLGALPNLLIILVLTSACPSPKS